MDLLAEVVQRWPDRPALTDGERRWSFAELDHEVARRASGLAEAGARPDAPLGVLVRPSAESAVTIHAALRLGAVLCPLHGSSTTDEQRVAIDGLRAELLVDEVGEVIERVQLPRPVEPVQEPPLAVIWTSGTSGSPRGIALSARGLRQIARGSQERLGLVPSDRWYAALSPAHVGGLALILRAAQLGSSVVAPGAYDVAGLAEGLRDGSVTHASLVPTMLRRLLDFWSDAVVPDSVGALLVGGTRTPETLVERAVRGGWPVALTYGLTEATSQVATAAPDLVRRKPGCVGAPLVGVELRVDDDSGEILVAGPTVAMGVWGREDALVDEDGWLHTGDLGWIDDEGDLWVTGRLGDRIITGGANVDPEEVELVLQRHPAVREAAVVGVPDEEWGERVVAVLILKADEPPPGRDFTDYVAARLSPPKRPKSYVTMLELPRNANGKLDRDRLRTLVTT
jgi:O-succinylbenzoic acid--CoA ligase